MKIRPVGVEVFHTERRTDGRTDRHNEGNSRFSQIRENAYQACVPSAPATSLVMFPLDLSTAAVSYKESDRRWFYIFESLNILTDIHYRYTLISTGNNIILRTQLPYYILNTQIHANEEYC